jgi:hypothetical protein
MSRMASMARPLCAPMFCEIPMARFSVYNSTSRLVSAWKRWRSWRTRKLLPRKPSDRKCDWDYSNAVLGNLTPSGACKEDGCTCSTVATASGARPKNVPILFHYQRSANVYISLGGGGMFVADITRTPMKHC